jgi:hypothetical protein
MKFFPCNHFINKKKILFPAKQKTAQFFPFLFCFTRELNPYSPIDGRGGRRRMRGSMDVVDAERLQRSGVAMVGFEEENVYKRRNR